MIKLEQIKMPINFTDKDIIKKCCEVLKINKKSIKKYQILKQAIDARKKPNIFYVLNIGFDLDEKIENQFINLKFFNDESGLEYKKINYDTKPIVVGFGPSGMFCALSLARMGLKPIVIEQGKCVEEREKDVQDFWQNRKLNVYSNVQFGEGGAGTFSDGKLNTNLNNIYCKKVIRELYNFGAPQQILYFSKPHIGSDKLKNVVKNIRKEIIKLGGEIRFSTKFIDFSVKNNKINLIKTQNVITNEVQEINTNHLILCVGHSARNCFEVLYNKGIVLHQKPFAMGVRIEQDQQTINTSQYGQNHDKNLPNADYKLAVHLPSGRSVFTFCMCPGGKVVASSSEEGEVVTNGMSNFARDEYTANSAILVNVIPDDFQSSHPLAGVYFQQKYEKLAFVLGGQNYDAPAQSVGQFLGKSTTINNNCTYKPAIKICDISKCLPDFVSVSIKQALPLLNQKMPNFACDDNLLIAIESRSSCPLTILRDENYQSNIKGIYPCGEGAGYAGGIISSAQDGIKVAEQIYKDINNIT